MDWYPYSLLFGVDYYNNKLLLLRIRMQVPKSFIDDANTIFDKFEEYYPCVDRKKRHVTLGDETITWQMLTGNFEIVTKTLNTITLQVEYLYLKEKESRYFYKRVISHT